MMKNKEMLRKIYYENKATNRNAQRQVNIGLIGILSGRNGHDSHNRRITFV